jgi:hypothetical protein
VLWRDSRDGFGAAKFHRRWDDRANTLALVMDTKGNVFGGFTPVEWESSALGKGSGHMKGDDSLQSFLFTLRNSRGVPSWKFALRAESKQLAIWSDP